MRLNSKRTQLFFRYQFFDKKKKKKVALNGFVFLCFHFPYCIRFCNYVEEELSLFFNLVSLQIDDGASKAGLVRVPVAACSTRAGRDGDLDMEEASNRRSPDCHQTAPNK